MSQSWKRGSISDYNQGVSELSKRPARENAKMYSPLSDFPFPDIQVILIADRDHNQMPDCTYLKLQIKLVGIYIV